MYDEMEEDFYCEDGESGKCDRDCRDCDIHHIYWKEHKQIF